MPTDDRIVEAAELIVLTGIDGISVDDCTRILRTLCSDVRREALIDIVGFWEQEKNDPRDLWSFDRFDKWLAAELASLQSRTQEPSISARCPFCGIFTEGRVVISKTQCGNP